MSRATSLALFPVISGANGVDINFTTNSVSLSTTIDTLVAKNTPEAGDQVMIYDFITKTNKKTTVASLSGIVGNPTPAGTIISWSANTAPTGYLLCDGSAINRTTYASLYAVIGTTYGVGNGSTTFNIPDLRGLFIRGFGTNSNGVASGTFGAKQAASAGSFTFQVNQDDGDAQTGSFTSLTMVTLNGNSLGYGAGTGPVTVTVTPGDTRPGNIAMLYCIKF